MKSRKQNSLRRRSRRRNLRGGLKVQTFRGGRTILEGDRFAKAMCIELSDQNIPIIVDNVVVGSRGISNSDKVGSSCDRQISGMSTYGREKKYVLRNLTADLERLIQDPFNLRYVCSRVPYMCDILKSAAYGAEQFQRALSYFS